MPMLVVVVMVKRALFMYTVPHLCRFTDVCDVIHVIHMIHMNTEWRILFENLNHTVNKHTRRRKENKAQFCSKSYTYIIVSGRNRKEESGNATSRADTR